MFKKVLSFFGPNQQAKAIHLQLIRKYQEKRRAEVSPTMKKQVTAGVGTAFAINAVVCGRGPRHCPMEAAST
jgi:hypothetical protein